MLDSPTFLYETNVAHKHSLIDSNIPNIHNKSFKLPPRGLFLYHSYLWKFVKLLKM